MEGGCADVRLLLPGEEFTGNLGDAGAGDFLVLLGEVPDPGSLGDAATEDIFGAHREVVEILGLLGAPVTLTRGQSELFRPETPDIEVLRAALSVTLRRLKIFEDREKIVMTESS